MIALGLALQVAVASYATMPGVPAPSTGPLMDSLRREQTHFLIRWRKEWMLSRQPSPTHARLAALHCHSDGSWKFGAPNIIRSSSSKRSFCPVWLPADDSVHAPGDDGLDAALTEESRRIVRRERAALIARLAGAAVRRPADGWISGQLVRLHLDQGDTAQAAATASQCRASMPWCLLLQGLVAHRSNHIARADSIFGRALRAMSPEERCEWQSVRVLLDRVARDEYERLTCGERAPIDESFWWLADPLYMEPGNARRAEHLARAVDVRLHAALSVDERWNWLPRYGGDALAEMVVRYGWPSHTYWAGLLEDGGHFEWLGFRDSSVNVAPEYSVPRYQTAPGWRAVLDPFSLDGRDWGVVPTERRSGDRPWPREHMRLRTPIHELGDQTVALRRQHDALIAVALQLSRPFMDPAVTRAYDVSVVMMRGPADSGRRFDRALTLDTAGTIALTGRIPAVPMIVSTELLPADRESGPVGRARRALNGLAPLSGLRPGEIAMSDPLFFRPDKGDDQPMVVDSVIARLLGSLTLTDTRVGLFWELYGVPPTDTVELSLRLLREDRPGLLRRIGARVGLLDASTGDVRISWREPRRRDEAAVSYEGSVPVQARSIVLDLSRIEAGSYIVEITARRSNQASATTRRNIVLAR